MEFKKLTLEDDLLRCELLGITMPSEYGIGHFSGLTPERYEKLLAHGFIVPDDCQNYSPPADEMYNFCKLKSGFTMHGYAVSREREDCRISIEGVEGRADTLPAIASFVNSFRRADDFTINWEDGYCYCWYD